MFKNLVRRQVENDYMHPECNISVLEKYEMFSIWSEFPINIGDKTVCIMGCLDSLNSDHVTKCPR